MPVEVAVSRGRRKHSACKAETNGIVWSDERIVYGDDVDVAVLNAVPASISIAACALRTPTTPGNGEGGGGGKGRRDERIAKDLRAVPA